MEKLKAAIIECMTDSFIDESTGTIFNAVHETDLISRLRDKGWRLPTDFLYDVRRAGFSTRQAFTFKGPVRRHMPNHWRIKQRKLSQYQTLIMMKEVSR